VRVWLTIHKRLLKQLVYGFSYLFILAALAGLIYYLYFIPEPSCFDDIQNQDEAAVDCGGTCIDCELKTLKLLVKEAKVFDVNQSRLTIIAEIVNPSSNYVLKDFDYEFQVFNSFGDLLKTLSGRSYINTNQVKYLVVPALDLSKKDIGQVKIVIPNENWEPKSVLPSFNLKFTGIKTTPALRTVQVDGKLVNDFSTGFSSLTLVAVLFNKNNQVINASTTKLDEVAAFSENQFTIFFPDLNVQEVNLSATKVLYEIKR
jgi:hypothetical protein